MIDPYVIFALGVFFGIATAASVFGYLFLRLERLPERPVDVPAPPAIDVHPELRDEVDDIIARAQAFEADNVREFELMRLERATHALQPYGWFHVAGRCRQ